MKVGLWPKEQKRRRGRSVRTLLGQALVWLGIASVLFWTLFPIYWLVSISLKTRVQIFSMPPLFAFAPTAENYQRILAEMNFGRYFLNSLIIAGASTIVVLFAGLLSAYAFSRMRFAGRKFAYFLVLAIRTLPPVAAIPPIFLLYMNLSLKDTPQGMVLLYSAFFVSFAVLMMKSFFDEVPVEIDEAAMVDGCGRLRILWNIVLPVVAPGTAATAIFAFISAWNEFFFALVFTASNAKTAPVALASFVGESGVDWGVMTAGSTIVMLPSLLLIWIIQKHLIKGLAVGAVK